jgi:hypothetical protein
MMRRFVVPFINSRGQQHVVVVELSDDEAADAYRNLHVFSTSPSYTRHSEPCNICRPDSRRSTSCLPKFGAYIDVAPVDNFIAELRSDPAHAPLADEITDGLHALADNADERAIELSDSINWILRQPRSLREKLQAIVTLIQWDTTATPGTSVSMKKLTGWI